MQSPIVIGDTLRHSSAVPAYSAADGWVLHYRLIPRVAGDVIDIDTVPDAAAPAQHLAEVAATVTAEWVAGDYSWVSWVDLDGDVYSVGRGVTTLLPDPRSVEAPFDLRTQAALALAAARAALAAWTPTQRRYRIGDREMEFNSPDEIIKVIRYWEAQVAAEDPAAGARRKVHVRLGRV